MHASRMRTAELLLVVGLCVLSIASSLKICAFNVQSFGESKANNERVMGILLKVLCVCVCVQQLSQLDTWWIHFFLFVLLISTRFSLGATCASFRRSETLKEKSFKLWSKISTGTSFNGLAAPASFNSNFVFVSADLTNPTLIPI